MTQATAVTGATFEDNFPNSIVWRHASSSETCIADESTVIAVTGRDKTANRESTIEIAIKKALVFFIFSSSSL